VASQCELSDGGNLWWYFQGALTCITNQKIPHLCTATPEPENPHDDAVAKEYIDDFETWAQTARIWTDKYAAVESSGAESELGLDPLVVKSMKLDRLMLQAGNLLKPLYALQIVLTCMPHVISEEHLFKNEEPKSCEMPRIILKLSEVAMLESTFRPIITRSLIKIFSCSTRFQSTGAQKQCVDVAFEFIFPLLHEVKGQDQLLPSQCTEGPEVIPKSQNASSLLATQILDTLAGSTCAEQLTAHPFFTLLP